MMVHIRHNRYLAVPGTCPLCHKTDVRVLWGGKLGSHSPGRPVHFTATVRADGGYVSCLGSGLPAVRIEEVSHAASV